MDPVSDDPALWASVPRLLEENRYLVLATVDDEGHPWATPLFFAAPSEDRLVWVSAPDSRHSQNLDRSPGVSITVFDSHAPVGGAEALYLLGRAGMLHGPEAAGGLAALNARLPADRQLTAEDLPPCGTLRVYAADISSHSILVRGGDDRFDNATDARLRVLPSSRALPRTSRREGSGSA